MSWFDILLLGVMILHIINGFAHGLVRQLFDIVGFVVIIILSFWGSRYFCESLAKYINPEDLIPYHDVMQTIGIDVAFEKAPQLVAGVIAFLLLFLLLSIAFRIFSGGFKWINRIPLIGFFNRVGGAFFGAAIGAVFVYIIIAAVSLIPLQLFVDALESSEAATVAEHYLTPIAEELKEMAINFYLSLRS